MKISIKEMKLKGEQDDKVKFTAKVKDVYKAKDVPLTEKNKYTVARQNVLVEDESDSIKVIISFKSKDDVYSRDIIGKEVEVDGGLSIWDGKMNIFGKLIFKEGEAPARTAIIEKPKGISMPDTILTDIKIREEALKRAMEFWTARIGDKMEEQRIITTAKVFEKYIAGDKITFKKETVKEEKSEIEKEGEEIEKEEKISAEKITLINEIMGLKESQHVDGEVFKDYCDGEDIKTLTIEKLKEIKKKLNEQTEDIPF